MKRLYQSEQLGIKNIYASNFLHATLWAYVTGQKQCGKEINEAIRSFVTFFDVPDLEIDTLKHIYFRKNKEYVKCAKSIQEDARAVFDVKPDEVERVLSKFRQVLNQPSNGR